LVSMLTAEEQAEVERVGQAFAKARDDGLLICDRCGRRVSAGERSLSVQVGVEGRQSDGYVLVACESCAPDLVAGLDEQAARTGGALGVVGPDGRWRPERGWRR
jgi:hypothetical protein